MKTCKDCAYAEWEKTKSGRLHPSGDGKCKYPYEVPAMPSAFYWIGSTPVPSGGHINRRKENTRHCPYYQRDW